MSGVSENLLGVYEWGYEVVCACEGCWRVGAESGSMMN